MPVSPPQPRWRRFRLVVRLCRIATLLGILALLGTLVYLNLVGVPRVLRLWLQGELLERGAHFHCERIRWHWYRGLAAEKVQLGPTGVGKEARAEIDELALDLNWSSLLRHHRLELEHLEVRGGRLVVQLEGADGPPDPVSLEGLAGRLRLGPDGLWELDGFTASLLGVTVNATATVSHVPEASQGPPSPQQAAAARYWRTQLRELVQLGRRMHFTSPPEFFLLARGDARDLASFRVTLRCQAAGARTPWIDFGTLRLEVDMNQPPPTNGWLNASLSIQVDQARTPWGDLVGPRLHARVAHPATNLVRARIDWDLTAHTLQSRDTAFHELHLQGQSAASPPTPDLWTTRFILDATELTGPWGQTRCPHVEGNWHHRLTALWPSELEFHGRTQDLETLGGKTRELAVAMHLRPPAPGAPAPGPDWGFWQSLARGAAEGEVTAADIALPDLALEHLHLAGRWQAPSLQLDRIESRLYGGQLKVQELALDVVTREARLQLDLDFDLHRLGPRLGEGAERWLAQFSWAQPPRATASARAILPAWTNAAPDWRAEVLPTLELAAFVQGENAGYRDVPFREAQTRLFITNQTLRLQDLHVIRPEGEARLDYELHLDTREFRWEVEGDLDLAAVGPAIDSQAPKLTRLFSFTSPSAVQGTIWGRWSPPRQVDFQLHGVLSQFTFRGEPIDELRLDLVKTGEQLTATQLELHTGSEWVRAPQLGYNLASQTLVLTNVECEIDPLRVARTIGPNVVETLSPYQFAPPPRGRVEGRLRTGGGSPDAHLTFDVTGGPFRYFDFRLPEIQGQVMWHNDRVLVTNLLASFYRGQLGGHLAVTTLPTGGAEFVFQSWVKDCDLREVLNDVLPMTNRIEGQVSGTFNVTRANPADWQSWEGGGSVVMRDGLLWDLPVFGVVSTVLNTVVPGLGNNRAKAAKASFTMQRSVLRTEDLAIEAGPTRLHYKGTVDFEARVNARVEAEVFPTAPLVGPLLSLAFSPLAKVLIFKVTGTLGQPELQPVYIPKFLLPILNPFGTLKDLFPPTEPPSPPGDPKRGRAP